MGRPPCCEKVGIKKGPWTPEEDIILVSYIQEHGPGNWRSVPTNTGLLRCSKSCRLRWTNYLRPGIKRGNFTTHEEGMIIHLQALLGNKWAAIASYLPQRTDNDIKNYWNTHLKKKLKKFQSAAALDDPHVIMTPDSSTTSQSAAAAAASSYASSTANISRLLEGWMRSSPPKGSGLLLPPDEKSSSSALQQFNSSSNSNESVDNSASLHCYRPKEEEQEQEEEDDGGGGDFISSEEFVSILSVENLNNVSSWEKSTAKAASQNSADHEDQKTNVTAAIIADKKNKQRSDHQTTAATTTSPPLSILEKWLLDESSAPGQVEEINHMMELSPIF